MIKNKSSNVLGAIAVFILAAVFIFSGIKMVYGNTRYAKLNERCTETTVGTVTGTEEKKVMIKSGKHGSNKRHDYYYSVEFVYEVDGTQLQSSVKYKNKDCPMEGDEIEVRYDPGDASVTCTDFDNPENPMFSIAEQFVFGALALFLGIHTASGKRSRKEDI